MNCGDVLQAAQAFVDGELRADIRERINAHAQVCESCRMALDDRQRIAAKIAAAVRGRAMAPASIADRARARLASGRTGTRCVRSWTLGAVGAAVLVGVLAALLVTRPSPAQAVLRQVINAAHDVESCHIVLWLKQPGPARDTQVTWYAQGRFRREAWRGDTLAEVQGYDGSKVYIYDPRTNVALVSDRAFGAPFEGFTASAILAPDVIGSDADIRLDKTEGSDGRTLNRLTVTQARERLVMLADQVTDLPVMLSVYALHKSRWELVAGTDVLEFNVPLDEDVFAPKLPPDARVIDRDQLMEEWWRRYERGMNRVKVDGYEAVLRDFQVTTAGDVYVVGSLTAPPPVQVRDTHLEDNLGTVYLKVDEGFQAGSDPCAMFVPLTEMRRRPDCYLFRAEARVAGPGGSTESKWIEFRVKRPVFSPSDGPILPNHKEYAQRAQTNVGFLYPGRPAAVVLAARARAEYWEEHGELRRALDNYKQLVETADCWTYRRYLDAWASACTIDPWTWRRIGSLYEQAAMRAEAHDAYERGLEAAKDQSYAGFSDAVVKDLLAGVERTR